LRIGNSERIRFSWKRQLDRVRMTARVRGLELQLGH